MTLLHVRATIAVAVRKMKCGELSAFPVGPAIGLCVRHQEMLMCVMCSLRVCIPGEILGAEAGERNESCAVNHSLPRRSRGETHAESSNCIQSAPQQHTIKSDTSPPARMQSAAQISAG